MKRLNFIIWSMILLLSYPPFLWAAPALKGRSEGLRVLIEVDNYKLAKYEPAEGTYLGAYVYQDTLINGDMKEFNRLTGKKHASFFLYSGYGHKFPQWWIDQLKEVGAVAHIAWEPTEGLDKVKERRIFAGICQEIKRGRHPCILALCIGNERQLDRL